MEQMDYYETHHQKLILPPEIMTPSQICSYQSQDIITDPLDLTTVQEQGYPGTAKD